MEVSYGDIEFVGDVEFVRAANWFDPRDAALGAIGQDDITSAQSVQDLNPIKSSWSR